MKKQKESKNGEDLKLSKTGKIIDKAMKKAIVDARKQEMEKFAGILKPALDEIDEVMEKITKNYTRIRLDNFRYKMAFITFNAILLALMVGSSDNIDYGLLAYIFLFFSFLIGIVQFVVYYFINMFDYIKEKSLADKCKIVFKFCRSHKQDEDTINDTKSFLRNVSALEFENSEKLDSIPLLLEDFNKKNSILRTFLKNFFSELSFYIPLIVGFALIISKVIVYISR